MGSCLPQNPTKLPPKASFAQNMGKNTPVIVVRQRSILRAVFGKDWHSAWSEEVKKTRQERVMRALASLSPRIPSHALVVASALAAKRALHLLDNGQPGGALIRLPDGVFHLVAAFAADRPGLVSHAIIADDIKKEKSKRLKSGHSKATGKRSKPASISSKPPNKNKRRRAHARGERVGEHGYLTE